jgi:hypothetical protein
MTSMAWWNVCSGTDLCGNGWLGEGLPDRCDRRVFRCAHNRTCEPVRCAHESARLPRLDVPSNTCANKGTIPPQTTISSCGRRESGHNNKYKENLREQKPTVVYSHERLLRWTGIGKTYRYNDGVVKRFCSLSLVRKARFGGPSRLSEALFDRIPEQYASVRSVVRWLGGACACCSPFPKLVTLGGALA